MVVLQVLAVVVSTFAGGIGYSTTLFFVLNRKLTRRDFAYQELMTKGELTDRHKILDLLEFVRGDLRRVADSPEFSQYGMMRRWKEVYRLVLAVGRFDQREQYKFAALHPIYGYTKTGDECLVAGFREFHVLYSNRVKSLQQKQAFLVLCLSVILQFVAIVYPL